MNASPEIFRAYDIRGIANQELTTEIAVKVGMAYGTYLNRNNLLVEAIQFHQKFLLFYQKHDQRINKLSCH